MIEKKQCELIIKTVDKETGVFEGHGSVFGNTDSQGDIIVKGAFKNSLTINKPNNIKMLWQHRTDEPIGYYTEIKEDSEGLYVKGQLLINEIARAREAYALLKNNAIDGLSVGFTINPGGSNIAKDGNRYLTDLKLWEISIVTFPANEEATIETVKSDITTIREYENLLREVGVSKTKAKQLTNIATNLFKDEALRDVRAYDSTNIAFVKNLIETITRMSNNERESRSNTNA